MVMYHWTPSLNSDSSVSAEVGGGEGATKEPEPETHHKLFIHSSGTTYNIIHHLDTNLNNIYFSSFETHFNQGLEFKILSTGNPH
jgi:hypothetical protein